jgi:hypothetical protein
MHLDLETILEIEDYIQHLDEVVGLAPGTMKDVEKALEKLKKELKTKEK